MDGTFESSKEVEIWGSKIRAVWCTGRTVHPTILTSSWFSKLSCGRAWLCWGRISGSFFGRPNSPEKILQSFKVWIYRSELTVWPRGIISTKSHPFCIPKKNKNSGHDLPRCRDSFKLTLRRIWKMPFNWLCFLSAVASDLHHTAPFWEPAIGKAQRVWVLSSAALKTYTFLTTWEFLLPIPSLPKEIQNQSVV